MNHQARRRHDHAGSISPNGNGFRWFLTRRGTHIRSKTWPTRDLAETELAKVLADPTFVHAAPAGRKRKTGPRSTKTTRPISAVVVEQPAPPSGPTDDEVDAAELATPAWGKPSPDGVRRCLPCGGEGIDRRPGPGAGACCLNCLGLGSG